MSDTRSLQEQLETLISEKKEGELSLRPKVRALLQAAKLSGVTDRKVIDLNKTFKGQPFCAYMVEKTKSILLLEDFIAHGADSSLALKPALENGFDSMVSFLLLQGANIMHPLTQDTTYYSEAKRGAYRNIGNEFVLTHADLLVAQEAFVSNQVIQLNSHFFAACNKNLAYVYWFIKQKMQEANQCSVGNTISYAYLGYFIEKFLEACDIENRFSARKERILSTFIDEMRPQIISYDVDSGNQTAVFKNRQAQIELLKLINTYFPGAITSTALSPMQARSVMPARTTTSSGGNESIENGLSSTGSSASSLSTSNSVVRSMQMAGGSPTATTQPSRKRRAEDAYPTHTNKIQLT